VYASCRIGYVRNWCTKWCAIFFFYLSLYCFSVCCKLLLHQFLLLKYDVNYKRDLVTLWSLYPQKELLFWSGILCFCQGREKWQLDICAVMRSSWVVSLTVYVPHIHINFVQVLHQCQYHCATNSTVINAYVISRPNVHACCRITTVCTCE